MDINPNEQQTILLPAGQVLSIAQATGASGRVVRLAASPGGGNSQSTTVITGVALSFGAYADPERFEIFCTAGTVTYSIAIPDPSLVQYDAEATALLSGHAALTATHGATGAVAGTTNTQTLTNKRITKRTGTTTSSATPTINTDDVEYYELTAQAVDIASFTTNLTGTPTKAQTLWIAITGTAARVITWGASFEASTVALPTTTVLVNRLDVGFIWNDVSSKWRCVTTA